jgi:hypothetical protein
MKAFLAKVDMDSMQREANWEALLAEFLELPTLPDDVWQLVRTIEGVRAVPCVQERLDFAHLYVENMYTRTVEESAEIRATCEPFLYEVAAISTPVCSWMCTAVVTAETEVAERVLAPLVEAARLARAVETWVPVTTDVWSPEARAFLDAVDVVKRVAEQDLCQDEEEEKHDRGALRLGASDAYFVSASVIALVEVLAAATSLMTRGAPGATPRIHRIVDEVVTEWTTEDVPDDATIAQLLCREQSASALVDCLASIGDDGAPATDDVFERLLDLIDNQRAVLFHLIIVHVQWEVDVLAHSHDELALSLRRLHQTIDEFTSGTIRAQLRERIYDVVYAECGEHLCFSEVLADAVESFAPLHVST